MYDLSTLMSSFRTLVGWEDTDTLSTSDSGLYFQEAHPLLTLRAMRGIMPKDLIDRYPNHENGRLYNLGDKVQYNGKVYTSLVGNNDYIIDTIHWKEYDILEDYLSTITDRGIKRAVTTFVNEKMANLETKNIVDRRTLFDGAGRKEARTANTGKLVGFEITPFRSFGIKTSINKVGLQMYGNTGQVTLYLFHSSKSEPISIKTIDITSDKGNFVWVDLTWTLPYIGETNAGGNWYIVYDQNALPPYMDSINFGRDWPREPCGTCNKGDALLYRLMQKYVTLSPFYAAESDWDGKLWDLDDNIYCPGDNFGLNFMFTISCDITDTLLLERNQFAHVVQLEVATEALKTLALNPEVAVNRVQSNAERDSILFEVEGNGQGIKGIKGDLDRAYKALSVDLKGLDPICMGCHNHGVKFTSI